MKIILFVLLLALVGCSQKDPEVVKMGKQVLKWVPNGTPLLSARQIMEQQHFICSVVSYTNANQMVGKKDAALWNTIVTRGDQHFTVTNISYLDCKTEHCSVRFTVLNGQTAGFSAGGHL